MSTTSPRDLILKANRAVASAQLLRRAGDIDGACNRPYSTMFDAAKAALLTVKIGGDPMVGKTHSGLISAFGMHLVKTGFVPAEFGRAFNRTHDIRQVADYTGDLIELDQLDSLIKLASEFVEWMNSRVISKSD